MLASGDLSGAAELGQPVRRPMHLIASDVGGLAIWFRVCMLLEQMTINCLTCLENRRRPLMSATYASNLDNQLPELLYL